MSLAGEPPGCAVLTESVRASGRKKAPGEITGGLEDIEGVYFFESAIAACAAARRATGTRYGLHDT
jgi:hypothetical protein